MVTGELKAQVDAIWDAFWSGGIANPLEVMEQITYLLFIRRLDAGEDPCGRPYSDLRWSRLKDGGPAEVSANAERPAAA